MSKNNIKNGAAAHREESIVEPAPPADDFICFECGDKFMTRTAWREHLRTHGVEPEPAPPAIPKNIPDPKGFPAEGDSILNPAYVEQLEKELAEARARLVKALRVIRCVTRQTTEYLSNQETSDVVLLHIIEATDNPDVCELLGGDPAQAAKPAAKNVEAAARPIDVVRLETNIAEAMALRKIHADAIARIDALIKRWREEAGQ